MFLLNFEVSGEGNLALLLFKSHLDSLIVNLEKREDMLMQLFLL